MKNILKLSGIIVMTTVIGFSFAACGGGAGGGGGSYSVVTLDMEDSDPVNNNGYEEVFTGETAPSSASDPLYPLSGTKDDLIAKVEAATGMKATFWDYSYDEVEAVFATYVPYGIKDTDKTTLMNQLKNNGYVVGVKDGGTYSYTTHTLVFAAWQE